MKIGSVRIRNFRGFEDQTVGFADHTCLVGPNGAGKSTILSALNIFFQEHGSATDVAILNLEDFHHGNTKDPIEITVTFRDLSERAKKDLSHYVRQDQLVVTTEAAFDPTTNRAPVRQFGERLVLDKFAPFFEDAKDGALVPALRSRFAEVSSGVPDMPALKGSLTKVAMTDALRTYEEQHPEACTLKRSGDQFYGSTRGKGLLEPYIQWVYLPAVKEASEEAEEAGNTALGKLLQRTVRRKMSFDELIADLRERTQQEYDDLLKREQPALQELSENLAKRLAVFAHPGAGLVVEWLQGSDKSVSITDPRATVRVQEGKFRGNLKRFGHGLQRAFLLAILQELALEEAAEGEDGAHPALVFACEEPELYQHPPQARHLSTVLRSLVEVGNQIILTTHSSYFVSGEMFDEIRMIRKTESGEAYVRQADFTRFANRIASATGKAPDKLPVARAKLQAVLRPEPAEMFFCQRVVLVEGLEDRAFITSALHCTDDWETVRAAGLHIMPTDGKSEILELLSIAQELEIPCFVVFDADGNDTNVKHRAEHERDNTRLMIALGIEPPDPFPKTILWGDHYAIWPTCLRSEVRASIGEKEWDDVSSEARTHFDAGASLRKNPLLVADEVQVAWSKGKAPAPLTELSARLRKFVGA